MKAALKKHQLSLDLKKRYMVSRAINISLSAEGKLIAYNSQSRPLKEINLDIMLILNTFLSPSTFRESYDALSKVYDMTERDLKTILTQLLNLNILTVEQMTPEKIVSAKGGFASLASHHVMLNDFVRVMAYKDAIKGHVKGKRVIDLGCGTGILSLFAAKAGAASVVAIEESSMAQMAENMFKANKVNHLVTLYNSNSKDVTLSEKADVLVHEIIGVDPLEENIMFYIEDAKKRLLKSNGILIPGKMDLYCIAYEDSHAAQLEAEARAFEDLYGLDFGPYIEEVKRSSLHFRHILSKGQNYFERKFISDETLLHRIDFNGKQIAKPNLEKPVNIKITRDGLLSGVLIYFKAELCKEVILSNSPFSKPTHWGQKENPFPQAKKVKKDSMVKLRQELKIISGKQNIQLSIL